MAFFSTLIPSLNLTPLIISVIQFHNKSLEKRFEKPPPLPDSASPVVAMKHRLKTQEGKALYAQRKSTVEPVFGIIKHVMGFRQFLLNGQFGALVSFTYNLGGGALQRSALRRKINREEHAEVPEQVMRWIWAGGRNLKGVSSCRGVLIKTNLNQ